MTFVLILFLQVSTPIDVDYYQNEQIQELKQRLQELTAEHDADHEMLDTLTDRWDLILGIMNWLGPSGLIGALGGGGWLLNRRLNKKSISGSSSTEDS